MPYALGNLVDGRPPGEKRAVSSDEQLREGEVLLSEADVELNPNGVWDAEAQTLREQTSEELAAEAFEAAKTDKLVEFFIHALEDVISVVPEAQGTYDRVPRELLDQAEIAHFLAVAENRMGDSTKLDQMLGILGKLRVKRGEVGAMTLDTNTTEDIEAEVW